jgi:GNAT superfamily N-acetyltransferase
MQAQIRPYQPQDEEAVIALSLRAWAPPHESMEQVMGREIFVRLHGDWREHQEDDVRRTLSEEGMHVWVAEVEQRVVAFAAARLQHQKVGEIYMLAVDPEHHNKGVGTALTDVATAWLAHSGMRVAMVETGGDPGHAPGRRVYEKAGYTLMPIARYFKAL